MIELYTAPTPNGWKASCTLEELGLAYEVRPIELGKNEQKDPEFLEINPNGRIPAIVDRELDGFPVFESGAIMIYLAEKTGKLLPTDVKGRSRAIQWLMFQMGGVGPMMGQANVFYRYWEEKYSAVIDRYQGEGRRLFEVLDKRLSEVQYLAGDYSIADIANWCWVRTYFWSGIDIEGLDNLQRWLSELSEREALQRGVRVPYPSPLDSGEGGTGQGDEVVDMARNMLQR